MSIRNKMHRLALLSRLLHISAWRSTALFITNPEQDYYFKRIKKVRSNRYLKNPEPWFACGMVEVLETLVCPGMRIFEWGSGASTLWFCQKGAIVHSVEHNNQWYSLLSSKAPPSCKLDYIVENSSDYIECLKSPGDYNIFVIDGRRRSECALKLISYINKGTLKEGSYVIFDDAHRARYRDAVEELAHCCKGIRLYSGLSNATEPKVTILYRV